ncbi:restriction endonuclease subunit S [Anaerovorax sp. IOR16]|uniref:restriction endonuclease subunit S n=1 Tax=Anaerovorax sp. IOR16 TaxID=2773458 RepID=UPI0019D0B795|nr:restriction endonuclease subunit S [Anaerovorax sp. IOR16]
MDKIELEKAAEYVSEKIGINDVEIKDYISTENMLPNKGGVCLASKKPSAGKVTKYQKGDVLTSNIRPYFKKIWLADRDGGCSNDILVIRNKSGYLSEYIYYVLSENKFFDYSTVSAKGTKMPRGDKAAIMQYLVPEYTIDHQKKIVELLENLDKKIRINNKLNENLDKQSMLLWEKIYEKVRKNEENSIGNLDLFISDYVANGSFKSLKENVTLYDSPEYALFMRNTDLKINLAGERKYIDKHSYEFLAKSKLFGGELIISNVGNVGSVYLCPSFDFPMSLGNNVIMIKSTNEKYDYNLYLYYFFRNRIGQKLLDGITGGSAQPKFNKTDFRNTKICAPSDAELFEFNNIVQPIYNMIAHNIMQNEKLVQLRDTLLPKLMLGEINLDNFNLNI